MKKRVFFLLLSLYLTGCATTHLSSYESDALTEQEKQYLATDGVEMLATRYPPGQTTINIQSNGSFGDLLVEKLRSKGFGIDNSGQLISYLVDQLNDNKMVHLGLITKNWRSDSLYFRNLGGVLTKHSQTQRVEP